LTSKHSRARRGATPQAAPAREAPATADPADAGEHAWREALARDPQDAVALTRLSRLLYEHGRHAEAVELMAPVRDGRVKLSNADRAAALAGLAMHEAALGRESEALDILSALPGNAAPGVAAFLAVRGADADSALTATERALRSGPESAALRNNHGIALLRAGDADAARTEFARAIALDPARPGPYYNLAILERFIAWTPTPPSAGSMRRGRARTPTPTAFARSWVARAPRRWRKGAVNDERDRPPGAAARAAVRLAARRLHGCRRRRAGDREARGRAHDDSPRPVVFRDHEAQPA
jgi:Flp pilus assembly protein TadD